MRGRVPEGHAARQGEGRPPPQPQPDADAERPRQRGGHGKIDFCPRDDGEKFTAHDRLLCIASTNHIAPVVLDSEARRLSAAAGGAGAAQRRRGSWGAAQPPARGQPRRRSSIFGGDWGAARRFAAVSVKPGAGAPAEPPPPEAPLRPYCPAPAAFARLCPETLREPRTMMFGRVGVHQ